jgi:hypothetical protein
MMKIAYRAQSKGLLEKVDLYREMCAHESIKEDLVVGHPVMLRRAGLIADEQFLDLMQIRRDMLVRQPYAFVWPVGSPNTALVRVCSLVPFCGAQWLSMSLQQAGREETLETFHMQLCDPANGDCVDRAQHGEHHWASALAVATAKEGIQEGILDFIDSHGCLESPTKGRGYGFYVSMVALGQGLFRHATDHAFLQQVEAYDITMGRSREYMHVNAMPTARRHRNYQ